MSSPTRWAGVPIADRRTERRALLVDAAFTLFGAGGEAAVSVRSVCRECDLNTRYFYESFTDVSELLGAAYDKINVRLGGALEAAIGASDGTPRGKVGAGIHTVLTFTAEDPRRGRLLFADAPANAVLAERRSASQAILFQLAVDEGARLHPDEDPVSRSVGATLYTGAMTALVQQWLAGRLGDDVDAVVGYAVAQLLR